MRIEVYWTDRAINDLNKAYLFNTKIRGEAKAWELVNQIRDFVDIELKQEIHPGVIDRQFAHLGEYFKIFEGDYRITYRLKGNDRYVIRVFDQRSHPDKNL